MLAFYLRGLIVAVLAGVIAGLVTSVANHHVETGWVGVAVAVIFVVVLLWGLIRRVTTTYTITNRRLTITSGLVSREMHETRLERVQNVNSRQRLLGRLLRVGNVDFDPPGNRPDPFTFPGAPRSARSAGGSSSCGAPIRRWEPEPASVYAPTAAGSRPAAERRAAAL